MQLDHDASKGLVARKTQLDHDASKGLVARKTPLFSLLQFVHERGVTEKSGSAAMFVGRIMPFVFSRFASNTSENSGVLSGTGN